VLSAPPEAWKVRKVVDGIAARLVERPDGPWGSAEAIVPAPPEAVLAHLVEFEAMPARVPHLSQARVLARASDQAVVYLYFHLPWPLSDRDYSARYRWQREADGRIVVDVEDAEHEGPPPGRAVRVRDTRACFVLAPSDGGRATRLAYYFHADFGGLLTRQMKEETVWRVPLDTLLGIRKAFAPRK
jgi:hypothetical protein